MSHSLEAEDAGDMASVAVNDFDRGKPFYPLIMLYVAQWGGFKELLARGLPGIERTFGPDPGALLNQSGEPVNELPGELLDGLRKLVGPLELASEVQNRPVKIRMDEIGRELVDNHTYLLGWLNRAAGTLLILAHEVTKDEAWHDHSALWEFLRHCRNAAAHGGSFRFVGDEPRREAAWHHLKLSVDLQGVNLFKDRAGNGLLSLGDPIRLLWDIEQAYPEMMANPGWVALDKANGS